MISLEPRWTSGARKGSSESPPRRQYAWAATPAPSRPKCLRGSSRVGVVSRVLHGGWNYYVGLLVVEPSDSSSQRQAVALAVLEEISRTLLSALSERRSR